MGGAEYPLGPDVVDDEGIVQAQQPVVFYRFERQVGRPFPAGGLVFLHLRQRDDVL